VVMMGDGVTEQCLYTRYVEAWTLTRFPAWNITFVNAGIDGDRATGGNKRFSRDVLPNSPTAITIDYGMHDGGYKPFEEASFKTFMEGMQGIADQAKAAKVRVAWCTPNPKEDAGGGPAIKGYNETLEKYAEGVQQIAATNGNALFIDQLHPFLAAIDKARAANPKMRIGGGDPVYPGPPGQALMAWSLLKGMNFPTTVASVEIDATAGEIIQSQNCKIKDLKVATDGRIEFSQLDAALPFFPADAKSILKWAPVLDELNDYRLKVTGLKSGRYAIRLSGTKVAEYSSEELSEGVNLAAVVLGSGPIAEQVKTVWEAIKIKDLCSHSSVARGVVEPDARIAEDSSIKNEYADAHRAPADNEHQGRMQHYFAAIKQTLVMKPHQVEILAMPNP